MRSIFNIKTGYGVEDAKSQLADWLYQWSDSFDYQSASFDDALKVAEDFLIQENPRSRFRCDEVK